MARARKLQTDVLRDERDRLADQLTHAYLARDAAQHALAEAQNDLLNRARQAAVSGVADTSQTKRRGAVAGLELAAVEAEAAVDAILTRQQHVAQEMQESIVAESSALVERLHPETERIAAEYQRLEAAKAQFAADVEAHAARYGELSQAHHNRGVAFVIQTPSGEPYRPGHYGGGDVQLNPQTGLPVGMAAVIRKVAA